MGDIDVYPRLLDMTKDECRRILRNLELEAYSNLVSVLRAQGSLSSQKKRLLQSVAQTLSIPVERHKAECRRAVASEKLATIAKYMEGPNTATDWAIEGRRLVPLMPRLVPQTAFTVLADQVANMAATEKAKFPPDNALEASLSEEIEDCVSEEPNVPEPSKTIQMCVNPASVTTIPPPLPSPSSVGSTHMLLQDKIIKNSDFPISTHAVQCPNNEESKEGKVSRKRGRTTSLDVPVRSSEILSSASAQPPQKKLQEAVEGNVALTVSKTSPNVHTLPSLSPTTSQQKLPQSRPTVKTRAKSPLLQSKPQSKPLKDHVLFPQSNPQSKPEEDLKEVREQDESQINTLSDNQHQNQPQSQIQQNQSTHPVVGQAPHISTSLPRTMVLPNHAVKLSLTSTSQNRATPRAAQSAAVSGTATAGTQKVIIVSSTAPSILQRSLSVPLVKAVSTAAANNPPIKQQVVLNSSLNNQQSQSNQPQPSVSAKAQQQERPVAKEQLNSTTPTVFVPQTTVPPVLGSTAVPVIATKGSSTSNTTASNTLVTTSGLQSTVRPGLAITAKAPPKPRPRGSSIVIPVTLNQQTPGGTTLSNVQLKTLGTKPTALHLKQDPGGVKILPLTAVSGTPKILPKPPGGQQIYLVSSASGANSTVSMVSRTVPTGARVVAVSSSGVPRVAGTGPNLMGTSVNAIGRPPTILSMTSKQGQAIQMGLNSGNTGLGINTGGTTAKPNVIVVQKSGTGTLNRGVTLTHGGKEVVGKVILGKAVSAQGQNTSQGNRPTVTVQKFTNATNLQMLQGTPGTQTQGNVIVLDLSQEELSSSTVLSELLQASGIIPSSNIRNITTDSAMTSTIATPSTTISTVANTSGAGKLSETKGGNKRVATFKKADWMQSISSASGSDFSVGTLGVGGLAAGTATEERTVDSSSQGTSLAASPSVVVESVAPASSTGMDIFSSALSAADINLDSFHYLEDSSLDGLASQLGVHSTENSSNSNSSCFVGENSEQSLDATMDCDS